MKTLKLSLLASAMLLGSFGVGAQNADEVMSKHVTAMGGDSWSKLSSMKTEATMSLQGLGDVEVTETVLKGKGARSEFSVMGYKGFTIVTPTAGWKLDPTQGQTEAVALKPEELQAAQSEMDITDDLIGYKEKGIKAEYIGKEDINGKSAHKLKLTDKEGKTTTAFFDAGTYYKVRETSKEAGPMGEMDVTTDYSDFKKFPEGIVVAMKAKNDYQEITVKNVELNKTIDESIFKAPAK
jgi:outer membrane lipoprotein-sorting protein